MSRGNVRLGSQVVFLADSLAAPDCRAPPASSDVLLGTSANMTSANPIAAKLDSAAGDSALYLATAAQRTWLDTLTGVLRVRGDTTISSGRIDGILLIDGRLTIAGTVNVRGLVIALGTIDGRSGRLELDGAIMSYSPPAAGQFAVELGEAVIRHSPCVIARAWREILPLRPVKARRWAEIF